MGEKIIRLRPEQEYITLQAVLQLEGFISTGGMAKAFIESNAIMVNNQAENRRGRKLYQDDVICVLNKTFVIKNYGN